MLTSHEAASAVAYTMTNAPPDAELRAAAEAGEPAESLIATDTYPDFNQEVRAGLLSDFNQTLDATLASSSASFSELPIDASGSIAGGTDVDGPVADLTEMLTKVATSARAQNCFTQNAFEYIAGVTEADDLPCRVAALAKDFREQNGQIPELFLRVLQSHEFLERQDLTEGL